MSGEKRSEFDVAVIGAGMGAYHAVEEAAKKKDIKVAFIQGFTFQEWPLAACIFLNPKEHEKWTSGVAETWQEKKWPNVTYFLSSVETVECEKKEITLMNKGPDAGARITYKALIVATGAKSPLIAPTPGMSLSERVKEVQACGQALKNAKTVIFNGSGLVGVEMCGDFRVHNGYGAKVILLSRSGKVLDSDYGEKSRKPDPAVVQKVTGILTEKFKVEVKHASVSDPTYTDAILSPGKLKLDNGETLDFDVYIPCYPVRPNTAFLTGGEGKQLLDASGAIISNECLQSQAYPEVFGVGVTTTKVPGHPVSARITIASQHCGKQALALLQGKEVQKFVDKGTPPPMDHPMNMKIGHGPGGYMIWSGLPGPAKICCCQCCGGGFPFCPPPCCWCCIPGCAHGCGTCCGPPEGEGPAIFMVGLLGKFPGSHGYKGLGNYGPEIPQQMRMS